jgi:hypothetical protein
MRLGLPCKVANCPVNNLRPAAMNAEAAPERHPAHPNHPGGGNNPRAPPAGADQEEGGGGNGDKGEHLPCGWSNAALLAAVAAVCAAFIFLPEIQRGSIRPCHFRGPRLDFRFRLSSPTPRFLLQPRVPWTTRARWWCPRRSWSWWPPTARTFPTTTSGCQSSSGPFGNSSKKSV